MYIYIHTHTHTSPMYYEKSPMYAYMPYILQQEPHIPQPLSCIQNAQLSYIRFHMSWKLFCIRILKFSYIRIHIPWKLPSIWIHTP